MAVVFKPALWKTGTSGSVGTTVNGGKLLLLPVPVKSFPLPVSWKGEITTGPYQEGASGPYGVVKNTVPLTVSGDFGKDSAGVLVDEAAMWAAWKDLETFLSAVPHTGVFELFMYYDLATTTYYKYKRVRVTNFLSDIGDTNWVIFPWSITAEALDPVVYTTGPGA